MSDAYVGQIAMFGFNFAPVGWATCDGQFLSISQNTGLFSIIGTYYGGNGTTFFALPDLQGRAVVCQGNGAGLTPYVLGESLGSEGVTLNLQTQPSHSHSLNATTDVGTVATAGGNQLAQAHNGSKTVSTNCNYLSTNAPNVVLSSVAVANAGATSPTAHNNMQPYQILNFCIAVQGNYPPRG